jgi:hypothetical protein
MQCDFCGSPEIHWVYPCRSFDLIPYDWGSDGDWAACVPCSNLIEAGMMDELVERTLKSYVESEQLINTDPKKVEYITDWVKALHAAFLDHRTGDRVPYVPASITEISQ